MNYDRKIGLYMREHKRLEVPLTIKSINNEGQFAGYASVFDVVDSQADIVERGAFSGTIRGADPGN